MVNRVNTLSWVIGAIAVVIVLVKIICEIKSFGLKIGRCRSISGVGLYLTVTILYMFLLVYLNSETAKQAKIADRTMCEISEYVDLI